MKKSAKAAVILLLTIMVIIVSCGEDPFFHHLVIKNDEGKTVTTIVVSDGDYKLPGKVDGLEDIEGWIYEDKEYAVGDVISVTKDSEITAITGTPVIVDNGDGTTQRVVVKKGETTLKLPKAPAERIGYVFDGWLVNGTLKEASASVEYTEGMKIEAKWTVVYTITYDANGGTGTVAPTLLRADAESVEISGNTGFSKDGLFFASWNTQADGKGTTYRKGDTYNKKENITLYAIWTDIITVTYYNGTKLVREDTGKPTDLELWDGSTLSHADNTEFDAWYTKSDFTGECYSDNKALTESVTLYAHFVDSNLDYSIPGAVTVKSSSKTSITSATIPSVYKGTPITMIAASGFRNCTSLTKVELPSSLRTISNYAFAGCSSLTSLTLPDGLTRLGENVIDGSGITSLTVPASVTSYASYTFFQSGLKSIEFKGGITSISANMFSCCYSLESVTLPDSLTSISSKGFFNCTNLKSIKLPESVTSIAGDAFSGCTNLKVINMGVSMAEAAAAGLATNTTWGAANARVVWYYELGDTGPAGGTIIYVSSDTTKDWNYIELAPTSAGSFLTLGTFGSGQYTYTGIDKEKENETLLKTYLSDSKSSSAAITAADEYYTLVGDTKYDEWYIPTMEQIKCAKGYLSTACWSSSTVDPYGTTKGAMDGLFIVCKNGNTDRANSGYSYALYCIRRF